MSATVRIPVGAVVERRKASSPWVDFIWRPAAVLPGEPAATPWTMLRHDGESATYYAGRADVELHASETSNYRENLLSGEPKLWMVLRPTGSDPPVMVVCVTADGSEGEGFTAAGDDIVDHVPMPEPIREAIGAFITEHHVERPFFKRKRDRANPEALGHRGIVTRDDE